tara:strand:- start:312 stop:839 length:528 start_codon:yes stop_codon:yes gene_type:complete
MTKKNIYNAKDFKSAVVVDNYPWGFKLKTKRAYWIETNNKGDRFCYQTLNPKNNKWCAVKTSTYGAAFVLTQDEDNFVSYFGVHKCDSSKVVEKWLTRVDYNQLNTLQKKQLCKIKAFDKSMEGVKISFVNSTAWSDEERAAHKAKQDEINGKLAGYANKLYAHCLVKNNLVEKG